VFGRWETLGGSFLPVAAAEWRLTLLALIDRDPEGGSEFSPDPWMLLQQNVVSPN